MSETKPLSIKHPAQGLLSLLLSVYSNTIGEDTPLTDLAWLNLALLSSSLPKKHQQSIKVLKQRIDSFNGDEDIFTVRKAAGLIVSLKVLVDFGIYKPSKLAIFREYFQKVSDSDWFRTREVPALFCFAFSSYPDFQDLLGKAKAHLQKELGNHHQQLCLTLFGLSEVCDIDTIIDAHVQVQIKDFLSGKRKSIEELSYLCLGLKESHSNLRQEAFQEFQDSLYEQIYETTAENSEVISLLLVILWLSNSEKDGDKVLEKLKASNIKPEAKQRVSEIIKSDNNILINFKDGKPLNPLIFESMSLASYALSRIPMSSIFLFPENLRDKVEAFLEASRGKNLTVASKPVLYLLLFVFDAALFLFGFKLWWPLFDYIFKSIEPVPPGIIKAIAQSFSWVLFLYPLYMCLNFNIGMLSKGWLTFSELIATLTPETFIKIGKTLRQK